MFKNANLYLIALHVLNLSTYLEALEVVKRKRRKTKFCMAYTEEIE